MSKIFPNVNWIVCYDAEAHAIDEWPVSSSRYTPDGKPISVIQTHDIASREQLAKSFVEEYGMMDWKLVISPPEGICDTNYCFETIYKPWPFRIFCFEGTMLSFASEPHSCETRIEELRDWLDLIN